MSSTVLEVFGIIVIQCHAYGQHVGDVECDVAFTRKVPTTVRLSIAPFKVLLGPTALTIFAVLETLLPSVQEIIDHSGH